MIKRNYFTVETGNNYYLISNTGRTNLVVISNLVYDVINAYTKGVDIEKLGSIDENKLMDYDINIENRKELTNAIKRFTFFKKNGFIEESKSNKISSEITGEIVSDIFADVNDITFEVTDNCNLKCKYCAFGEMYGGIDKRVNKSLPFSFAKKTIDFIFNHMRKTGRFGRQKKINVSFYGGEPLLKIDLIKKIINYIESLCTPFSFDYSMTTNGILLDKHIDYLIEKKFNLAISLDGNEQNNSYRVYKNGINSFNKVLRNTKEIELCYPEYYSNHINILTVLHNRNSIIESTNFCNSVLNKTPVFSQLSSERVLPSKKKEFFKLYSNISEEFRKAHNCSKFKKDDAITGNPFKLSFSSSIVNKSNFGYINYSSFFLNQKKLIPTDTCLPFQKSVFITVNGKLLPCESVGHNYSYGSVNEESCNINFHKTADLYNTYVNTYAQQCNNCYSFDDCSVCVIELLSKENNETCGNFKNYESYKKYLTRIIKQIESINNFGNKN